MRSRRPPGRGKVWGVATIELLLVESFHLRFQDPARMLHLAELARLAIERLEPRRLGFAAMADLRSRALVILGNAYRVLGELSTAELVLEHAVRWARRGSGSPRIALMAGDALASLFIDQGRPREASLLLDQVTQGYLEIGERHFAGRSLLKKATSGLFDGRPEAGIEALAAAVPLIEQDLEPTLMLSAIHTLAGNLTLCGRPREARLILWRARSMFFATGDPLILLRLYWREGLVYAALGDFERALAAVRTARDGFKSRRLLLPAAQCGRDLATIVLRRREAEAS